MMLTNDLNPVTKVTLSLNPVTKVTLSPCPTDPSLHQIAIERDIGMKDGTKSKWQFFLTDDEMIQFEDTVSTYNRGFVDC